MVPRLVEFHQKFEKNGLRVVALSSEDPKLIEGYVGKKKIPYRVGIDDGGNAGKTYGVTGIPAAFAIGPDGKVLWAGHPAEISDSTVEKWLRGAKAGAAGASPVRAAFEKREFARAWKLAEETLARPDASAEERALAEKARAKIRERAEARLAAAEKAIEAKDVLASEENLEPVARECAGLEFGTKAADRLAEIRKDPALAPEFAAAKGLKTILAAEPNARKSKEKQAIIEQLRTFAAKNKGTTCAEIARAKADEIQEALSKH